MKATHLRRSSHRPATPLRVVRDTQDLTGTSSTSTKKPSTGQSDAERLRRDRLTLMWVTLIVVAFFGLIVGLAVLSGSASPPSGRLEDYWYPML